MEALANNGVAKHKEGIRLYNQKYYTVSFDPAGKDKAFTSLYLKKVINFIIFSKKEELAFV